MTDTAFSLDDIIETQAPADSAEGTDNSEWPKLITDLAPGERPEGSVTVTEFADHINRLRVRSRVKELIEQEDMDPVDAAVQATADSVAPSTFYQAVRAQRNPLPHFVVRTTQDVEEKDADGNVTGTSAKVDERTYIPLDAATEWWENRPSKGASGVSRSEDDVQKRLVKAGRKFAQLTAAQERLAKVQAQVDKFTAQMDKYDALLSADGKTRDDAVKAAEDADEATEADKAISDSE